MYDVEVRKEVERVLKKLAKKDKITSIYISKKIKQIKENPYHFKPLRKPFQNYWRVHIGNYVLIYSIDEKRVTLFLHKGTKSDI